MIRSLSLQNHSEPFRTTQNQSEPIRGSQKAPPAKLLTALAPTSKRFAPWCSWLPAEEGAREAVESRTGCLSGAPPRNMWLVVVVVEMVVEVVVEVVVVVVGVVGVVVVVTKWW